MENSMLKYRLKYYAFLIFLGLVLPGMLVCQAGAAERVTVKAGIANLRSGPGTKYEVLWQVEQYHPFLVVEKKGNWYKIKDFEGDMAWIHKSLLSKMTGVITKKTKSNVRSEPNTKSRILFTVERGVPFKVLKRKGNWIRIEHADGEKGWIYKTLVW
ncbi:SH3 domain-containing protein [Desulfospira joergensenii]|uniref:SH3 domain-containing protein n=1 Tax=Desulfospira joergensenii TaxID=53329 RepID=UPI0003B75D5D|nr:SH3 domain-containing protein [Desulfospira joergensenii]